MPYGNPDPAGAMSAAPSPGGMDPGAGMPEKPMQAGAGGGTLHIGPDMLPEGMKLNKGDTIQFKVVSDQDADGDWMIEYDYGDKGEEKEESWEEGLKAHMSPRSGGEDETGQEAM